MRAAEESELEVALFRDDLPFRAQRALGLIPAKGLGTGRRALLFALATWLPIAVWAAIARRALPGGVSEPLLEHFGVHVRCLVAIPLFIVSEAASHRLGTEVVHNLLAYGLVSGKEEPRLRQALASVARLRDATLPWALVLGAVIAWISVGPLLIPVEDLNASEDGAGLRFGRWWMLYVARAIFIALLFAALWRVVLWTIALYRISRLDLSLVPTHPDRVFGLGFLERTPAAFTPFLLALSVALAATALEEVLFRGIELRALVPLLAAFLLVGLALMLAPLLVFMGPLKHAKRRALVDYGALVARHGRLVRERWMMGSSPRIRDCSTRRRSARSPMPSRCTKRSSARVRFPSGGARS